MRGPRTEMSDAEPTTDALEGGPPVRVSILVVSYQTRELTLACLRSVVEQSPGLDFELRLLDNASEDGSFEAIREAFGADPRFHLERSPENLGFARANNRLAAEARGEYLLLLNPDTVVLDSALRRLVDFADRTRDHLVWGGRTLDAEGALDPGSCHGPFTLRGLGFRLTGLSRLFPASEFFNVDSIGGWKRDSEREVGWVTGCLMLVDRDLWDRLEGFAPEFFMYGEECELQIRARALGARPIITPEATIVHYIGASETRPAGRLERINRGQVTIMNHHWSRPAAWAGRVLLYLNALTRTVGYRIAATLAGTAGLRERARTWSEVWTRRGEWMQGY